MVISFSNVLVQASVNSYGAAAMAGFAAYMKIDGFNILPVSSISMAATTFVGQNYGAGRLDRVKRSVWVTLAIGVIYLSLIHISPIIRRTDPMKIPRIKFFYGVSLTQCPDRRDILWYI